MIKLPAPYKELADYLSSRMGHTERVYIEARVPLMYPFKVEGTKVGVKIPSNRLQYVSPQGLTIIMEDSDPQNPVSSSFKVRWIKSSKLWEITGEEMEPTRVSTLKAVLILMRWGY